jgi:predicted transcriptional regulator
MEEVKLAILYALKMLKVAIARRRFIDILYETEITNYYEGLSAMGDLNKEDLVRSTTIGGEEHFIITPKGLEMLDLDENKLTEGIKKKIADCTEKVLRGEHDLCRAYTKITALDQETLYFQCGVLDNGQPVFEVRMATQDREQARRMAEYFRANSGKLREKAFKLLGEKNK